jgi:hypothetical protein
MNRTWDPISDTYTTSCYVRRDRELSLSHHQSPATSPLVLPRLGSRARGPGRLHWALVPGLPWLEGPIVHSQGPPLCRLHSPERQQRRMSVFLHACAECCDGCATGPHPETDLRFLTCGVDKEGRYLGTGCCETPRRQALQSSRNHPQQQGEVGGAWLPNVDAE